MYQLQVRGNIDFGLSWSVVHYSRLEWENQRVVSNWKISRTKRYEAIRQFVRVRERFSVLYHGYKRRIGST